MTATTTAAATTTTQPLDEYDRKSVYSTRSLGAPLDSLPSQTTREGASASTTGEEEMEVRAKARRHTFRVISAFMVCFSAGWGDGGMFDS